MAVMSDMSEKRASAIPRYDVVVAGAGAASALAAYFPAEKGARLMSGLFLRFLEGLVKQP